MNLTEKAAYMKGLIEGMGIKADSNEGKIYAAICDLLSEMALEVEELGGAVEELDDAIGVMDEDLDDLESFVYEDDDEEETDNDLYRVTCPKCGDEVYLDEDTILTGKIDCPNCGEPLEFDIGCGCGCNDYDHDDCDCDGCECGDEESDE